MSCRNMHSTYEVLVQTHEATSLLEELSRKRLQFLASSKVCKVCDEAKPRSEFGKHSHSHDGFDSRCRACKNRQARLRKQFKRNNPVPPPGPCPLCDKHTDSWVLDHCHHTDEMRGFLCNSCNVGLGHFDDDPDFLQRAVEWVRGKPTFSSLPRHLL